jgi:L-2-hydroxyglutarate oxidase LhgO
MREYDYLIVGAGIIGMSIAYELKSKNPTSTIAIIDKEKDVALHASGRNSGVLHAGFYYSADSLKARFTKEGNAKMKLFCREHGVFVRETKKIVVAKDKYELEGLYELQRRAEINGVETYIIDEERVRVIDPNIKTYKKALYSPTTASVNPKEVCYKLKDVLEEMGVELFFNTPFKDSKIKYRYLINSAGAYADKIAKEFGLSKDYTMLPFKGIYLKYLDNNSDIKTNIYPVPNLKNPFLGVHYTVTVDKIIKIGPTAIPAFWRENYEGFINFRDLALSEMQNYNRKKFIAKAKSMVRKIGDNFAPIPAGIRAQLLNRTTNELVQDFVIEHKKGSTHILNAVSPAFTCSFAFAKFVVDEIEKNQLKESR